MSNDFKFWAVRFSFLLVLVIDANVVFKIASDTFRNGHAPHPGWFVLAASLTLLDIIIGLLYYVYKDRRWLGSDREKDMSQIQVEMLAAYAAEQQKEEQSKDSRPIKKVV
jgi:hypothetical protein